LPSLGLAFSGLELVPEGAIGFEVGRIEVEAVVVDARILLSILLVQSALFGHSPWLIHRPTTIPWIHRLLALVDGLATKTK